MITVTNLSMHYGSLIALHQATFQVARGEVVGLVGPNGAGKSTTMKILTTYLYPTAGTASVGGKSILQEPLAVRRLIGYLPEVLPLYPDMEVRRYLDFVGRARGLPRRRLRQRLEWVTHHCGLKPVYRQLIRELSKGYRQRVGLAQALIHDPQVIILDEPTSGLDPHQILEIRHLIRYLASSKTVLLSTHILQEVEAVADRIVIIHAGRIVGNGTLHDLQLLAQQLEHARLAVVATREQVETALKSLPGITHAQFIGTTESVVRFAIDAPLGTQLGRQLGALAHARGWPIEELYVRPPTLEETFLALTERSEPMAHAGA